MKSHKFKKQFGQNFLRHQRYAEQMVKVLDVQPDDVVLEIGPGDGMVTRLLLESEATLVLAVEIDYQLIPKLVKKFGEHDQFELVYYDVLELEPEGISQLFYQGKNREIWQEVLDGKRKLKVIGSLPFNIGKKIIELALTSWPHAEKMVFILQEEVAQDYNAKPPKSSYLSNWISLFANTKKHASIPASQFIPKPKVNGAILEIRPYDKPRYENWQDIARTIRIAFSSPRKTLRNNFRAHDIEIPEEIGGKRASEVDLETFISLTSTD